MDKRLRCYKMIKETISLISRMDGISTGEAFDKFLNYCAVNLYLSNGRGVCFKTETLYAVERKFDMSLLKEVKSDVIGDVYYDIVTTKMQREDRLQEVYVAPHVNFPQAIFACTIDTASNMIGKPKNVLLYTATSDLTTYHISLVNRKLHELSLFSLFIGKKKIEEINLMVNSKNWEFANRWDPIKTSHLI